MSAAWKQGGLILALAVLLGCQETAAPKEQTTPLAGLTQIAILVAPLDEVAETAGVQVQQLEALARQQVRKMGLDVVPDAADVATLQIELTCQPSTTGDQYVYSLSLDLLQQVHLARQSQRSIVGSIWDTGSLGLTHPEGLSQAVYSTLETLISSFASARANAAN